MNKIKLLNKNYQQIKHPAMQWSIADPHDINRIIKYRNKLYLFIEFKNGEYRYVESSISESKYLIKNVKINREIIKSGENDPWYYK